MSGILVVFILFFLSALFLFAEQDNRFALVIGNGDYQEFGSLKNPGNDARDMAASLERLGFTVSLLLDADLYTMENEVVQLGNRLAASPQAVGFFFYAGHGIQSKGENYLIPVQSSIASEAFLCYLQPVFRRVLP